MTRKALGKGLEALIPRQPVEKLEADGWGQGMVPVDRILPNPWQPRRKTDPAKMDELVRSVRARGVLEPLLVRRAGGGVELVAGERRLRAAQLAGIKEVPVIFVTTDDIGSLELALIENIQREDLNPVDEARAYQVLAGEFGRTHEEIALQVGKDRTTVTNLLRLLRLPPEVLSLIGEGRLSAGHARALLALESPQAQQQSAARIVREGWSVREAERRLSPAAKEAPGETKRKPRQAKKDPHIERVEEAVRRRVGTAVHLHLNKRGGGKLELLCADREDLERVLELLGVQVY